MGNVNEKPMSTGGATGIVRSRVGNGSTGIGGSGGIGKGRASENPMSTAGGPGMARSSVGNGNAGTGGNGGIGIGKLHKV